MNLCFAFQKYTYLEYMQFAYFDELENVLGFPLPEVLGIIWGRMIGGVEYLYFSLILFKEVLVAFVANFFF